jgi:hypothetical protein
MRPDLLACQGLARPPLARARPARPSALDTPTRARAELVLI